jgi:hypothetical protein
MLLGLPAEILLQNLLQDRKLNKFFQGIPLGKWLFY